jgi:hypothetical protein
MFLKQLMRELEEFNLFIEKGFRSNLLSLEPTRPAEKMLRELKKNSHS